MKHLNVDTYILCLKSCFKTHIVHDTTFQLFAKFRWPVWQVLTFSMNLLVHQSQSCLAFWMSAKFYANWKWNLKLFLEQISNLNHLIYCTFITDSNGCYMWELCKFAILFACGVCPCWWSPNDDIQLYRYSIVAGTLFLSVAASPVLPFKFELLSFCVWTCC